jgi:hypothetical protein
VNIVAHTDGITPLHITVPIDKPAGAAKIVQVPEPLAKGIAHLVLHQHDLNAASRFLTEFENLGDAAYEGTQTTVIGTAIWHTALNATMKCFSRSNARVKLNPTTIFGDLSDTNEVRSAFDSLKSLRDKNIAHDDNDWLQAMPAALLAEANRDPKVINIQYVVVQVDSAYPENITRLRSVITKALAWVNAESNRATAEVRSKMESWSHEELFGLAEATGNLPSADSVHLTRP